ncbi:L-type lectin-domain containing protein [Luteolibacter marinus]|uniref:L-type lectin-domain containing protein n=1 Tax=Luteolibacter marinus TaxID=2776705 RepID=UPI001D01B711|nr:L-type lectin-domain containing protein [Luteolibacter marinus]
MNQPTDGGRFHCGVPRCSLLVTAAALGMIATASATVRTYRYYRFAPTELKGGITNQQQLSEFRFYNGGSPVSMAGVTVNGIPTGQAGENPGNLADGNVDTKWFNGGLAAAVFDFGAPVAVDGYDFATANDDTRRDPVSWTLEGRDLDTDPWTLIDGVRRFATPDGRKTFTTQLTLPAAAFARFMESSTSRPAYIAINGSSVDLDWIIGPGGTTTASLAPGGGSGLGAIDFATVSPPDNADTTYTLTATNGDGSNDRNVIVRTVAGGLSHYKYVRFTPTLLRDNAAANSVQISEFRFLNGLTPLLPEATENIIPLIPGTTNPSSPGAEGPDKLNDDNLGTKWLNFTKTGFIYTFSDADALAGYDGYYIATANDSPARDPLRWIIEGSDDKTNWTMIENVTAFDYPLPLLRQTVAADTPLPGDSIKPFANLLADAPKLIAGEPILLTWDTVAAANATIDVGSGPVPVGLSGSQSFAVAADTTAVLTATSAGGTVTTATLDIDVINPSVTTIAYADFDAAGEELALINSATVLNAFATFPAPANANRLRLNDDVGSQRGTAWFRKRIDASAGFSTTFGTQFISLDAGTNGADGMAFILQNNPDATTRVPAGASEDGLASNALNVKFDSYLNEGDLSAAVVQVRAGGLVLAEADLNTFPNVVPLPGNDPTDMSMNSGDTAPYVIRIDYQPGVPNDLDVYFNNALVIDSLDVDLAALGAVDGSGTGYVGFSARSGGQFEAHDITSWFLTEGPPPAAPVSPGAFAIKDFSFDFGTDMLQVTWGSNELKSYRITASTDGLDWTTELGAGISGTAASGETSATVGFTEGTKLMIRVEEE